MSAATQVPAGMTVAEFLAWEPTGGDDRWELVDGTPWAMAPETARHAVIQAEAARLLGNHLAAVRPDCRVATEPGIQPRVRAAHNVRVPDLAVTCAPWTDDVRLLREPVLIVEVFSPPNRADTWTNVWSYISIPTVAEILVLHTAEIRADLLRRQADGAWPDDPVALRAGDDLRLDSIGFSGRLAAFYRTAGL